MSPKGKGGAGFLVPHCKEFEIPKISFSAVTESSMDDYSSPAVNL